MDFQEVGGREYLLPQLKAPGPSVPSKCPMGRGGAFRGCLARRRAVLFKSIAALRFRAHAGFNFPAGFGRRERVMEGVMVYGAVRGQQAGGYGSGRG